MAPTEAGKSPELIAAELKKAQADADLAKANAAKADADAAKAELERAKLEKENAEWEEGVANRKRTAAAELEAKQIANDEKRLANEGTQRSWISEIGPDLTKVDRGKTEGADKPLFTTVLATRALEAAARHVAQTIFPGEQAVIGKVVLTTDDSLLDRLAVRAGVLLQIKVSQELLAYVLNSVPEAQADSEDGTGAGSTAELGPLVLATGIASAAAKTIPGLLSLISANRTLAAGDVTQDAYVTMVAVAGALLTRKFPPSVLLDETRLLHGGTQVEQDFQALQLRCQDLAMQVSLFADDERDVAVAWSTKAKTTLEVVQGTITALTKVDEKAVLSPLMTAASQELFADQSVKHIVVIKPAGASTVQLMSDRPLNMKDPIDIRTTAAIAFVHIDSASSRVQRAGVKTGESRISGYIGGKIDID